MNCRASSLARSSRSRTSRPSRRDSARMMRGGRLVVGGGAVGDGLGVALDRRQRRAQVVRHREQELLLEAPRALQRVGHVVDRRASSSSSSLGAARPTGQADAQVAVGDGGRGLGRVAQRLGEAAAQAEGDQRADEQDHGRREQEPAPPRCPRWAPRLRVSTSTGRVSPIGAEGGDGVDALAAAAADHARRRAGRRAGRAERDAGGKGSPAASAGSGRRARRCSTSSSLSASRTRARRWRAGRRVAVGVAQRRCPGRAARWWPRPAPPGPGGRSVRALDPGEGQRAEPDQQQGGGDGPEDGDGDAAPHGITSTGPVSRPDVRRS